MRKASVKKYCQRGSSKMVVLIISAFCLAVAVAATAWAHKDEPFVPWSASVAPASTVSLLAIDGKVALSGEKSLEEALRGIPAWLANVGTDGLAKVDPSELQWMGARLALLQLPAQQDKSGAGALSAVALLAVDNADSAEKYMQRRFAEIMRLVAQRTAKAAAKTEKQKMLADNKTAQEKLRDVQAQAQAVAEAPVLTTEVAGCEVTYVENGWAWTIKDDYLYIASDVPALTEVLNVKRGQNCLAQQERYQQAYQSVRYCDNIFVYSDLSATAPMVQDVIEDIATKKLPADGEDLFDDNNAELCAFLQSQRYAVLGGSLVGKHIICDGYLAADVAHSGALGRVLYNPAYNIAFPAVQEQPDNTWWCAGGNVRYAYDYLYELMGTVPLLAGMRDLPEYLLATCGVSWQGDVLGNLGGSAVMAVHSFDVSKVLALASQVRKMSLAVQDGEDGNPYAEGEDLFDNLQPLVADADWDISVSIKSRAGLQDLAGKIPALNALFDGSLSQEEWCYACPRLTINVGESDIAIRNGSQRTANALIQDQPCALELQKLSGGKSVFTWYSNNLAQTESLQQGLQTQNASDVQQAASIASKLAGKRQCGCVSITPQGLRICEVVEF